LTKSRHEVEKLQQDIDERDETISAKELILDELEAKVGCDIDMYAERYRFGYFLLMGHATNCNNITNKQIESLEKQNAKLKQEVSLSQSRAVELESEVKRLNSLEAEVKQLKDQLAQAKAKVYIFVKVLFLYIYIL
jgi:DNA repair exonuclease SbcCD ATPase subunit